MPTLEVPVSAFNLIVGAVYTERSNAQNGQPRLVVTHILYRHDNSERIGLTVRHLDVRHVQMTDAGDPPLYESPSYDFGKTVYLVGLSVHPDSWDDDDTGQV